jgi:hypothetical protein
LTVCHEPAIIEHMSNSEPRRNPFFPLVAISSVAFIITILALVAAVFGDERAPLAQLFDRYAGRLIGGEVVIILVTGFLALAVDRRQALRSQKDSVQASHDQQRPG